MYGAVHRTYYIIHFTRKKIIDINGKDITKRKPSANKALE